jgi:hypothetical protein
MISLFKELVDSALSEINTETLWSVIVEQGNLNMILEWIDFSFSADKLEKVDPVPKSEESSESNEEVKSNTSEITSTKGSIFSEKLTQVMIEFMYNSKYLSQENKEIILNYLVK